MWFVYGWLTLSALSVVVMIRARKHAPIIDETTGNECRCQGSLYRCRDSETDSEDGSLRRIREDLNDGRFPMHVTRNCGGVSACRIYRVDCVANYRGASWSAALAIGDERFLWNVKTAFELRLMVASLATAKKLDWKEAAGVNAFLMYLEKENA